ncbi:MAG: ribonuclease HII [Acholeplasmataceae bacterium]
MIYKYEKALLEEGYLNICGVDEVGRGPLAGPVVAAAVILKPNSHLLLTDSKKLTKKQRQTLVPQIKEQSLAISIAFVDHEIIDEINILNASKQAMLEAINTLALTPDYVLIDALDLKEGLSMPSLSIIKGDMKSASIAAASIIAKEARDAYMLKMDELFPVYGFKNHMGYPTKTHIEKIKSHGICPIHRKTFKPIKTWIENLEL